MVKMWLVHQFLTVTCSKDCRIAAQFLPLCCSCGGLLMFAVIRTWRSIGQNGSFLPSGYPHLAKNGLCLRQCSTRPVGPFSQSVEVPLSPRSVRDFQCETSTAEPNFLPTSWNRTSLKLAVEANRDVEMASLILKVANVAALVSDSGKPKHPFCPVLSGCRVTSITSDR
jgi:hypothetical protein